MLFLIVYEALNGLLQALILLFTAPRQESLLLSKKPLSCKYNQECWLKVRLPIILRKKSETGKKIFLPYKCSYVTEGDMYNCSWRDKFAEEHGDILEDEEGERFNGELSAGRISEDDF